VLKVPRQGKGLGSVEGKALGMNMAVSRREKLSRGFAVYDRKFEINAGRAAL
jgi:hypothetical protein